jgi:hypothetical protein
MEINNNRKDWALEKLGDFADYEKEKNLKMNLLSKMIFSNIHM